MTLLRFSSHPLSPKKRVHFPYIDKRINYFCYVINYFMCTVREKNRQTLNFIFWKG